VETVAGLASRTAAIRASDKEQVFYIDVILTVHRR